MRTRVECDGAEEGHQRGEVVREGVRETIDSVQFETFVNKRINTFTIATGSSDIEENVIVKVTSGDEFGVGSANPSSVTQETVQSIEAFLRDVPKKIVGTDETDIAKLHQRLDSIAQGNSAAKAAIDIAVYDLLAKREKKPLYRLLGGSKKKMLTDMTIGIESKEVTVQRALKHYKSGFRALKVKVGLDVHQDVGRVAAVRDALGPKVELRVDANQGFSVEEAVAFAGEMKALDVAFIEQPVKADDLAGLKQVRMRSPVPIMADECVRSSLDARKIARESIADMINVKLMKSAGIHDAGLINKLAEATGIVTMIGCMGEIQVSIAAALHFALSSENVKYADLDSHLNIIDDPSAGLVLEGGYLLAPREPGLGVRTPLDGA